MACFNREGFFSPAKTVKIIGSELNYDHQEYIIRINVASYEWRLHKRYSEFCRLNDTLPPELRDVAKQLLPKKQFFGSNSEPVVKERQKKLEVYLQSLFRSLPVMPCSLVQFLKFDVYEIHGMTEAMAEELYNEGDGILSAGETYSTTAVRMHAIARRMELLESTSNGNPKRDIGHLLDFVNQLKSLKVVGTKEKLGSSNIFPNEHPFHFKYFRSLRFIHLDDCNLRKISFGDHTRTNVNTLKVSNSLSCIGEVLLAGGAWDDKCELPASMKTENSWSSLTRVDFDSNKISRVDVSVSLMPNLEHLILSRNKLERLERLDELSSLKSLDVSYNGLTDARMNDLSLSTITRLDVSHNELTSFVVLTRMRALLSLDASFNRVEVADELCHLGNMASLVEVKLKGNPISTRPEYRLIALQAFGERFHMINLDSQKISEKEKDAILVRQALQKANCNYLASAGRTKSRRTLGTAGSTAPQSPSNDSQDVASKSNATKSSPERLPLVDDGNGELPGGEEIKSRGDCSGKASHSRERSMGRGERERRADFECTSRQKEQAGRNSLSEQRTHNAVFFGLQRVVENNVRSISLKQSRRRKYFLLPETLPNQNDRSLMSLLEDITDPPDSFGLSEVEYRQNNAGHVMWCTTLTNLRKTSHNQERPVCVCVTPLKVHIFKVDQLRGDAGIPKLRYFTYVSISDIHCFMIGCRHLYVRIVDRFHPSNVIVLLTFNRIKTESFLERVKKASRRNIPFLDDYEDPLVYNSAKYCEQQISAFLKNYENNSIGRKFEEETKPERMENLRFYQLCQLIPEAGSYHHLRTSAVVFSSDFIYVLFQDFADFPKSPQYTLENVPPKPAQHRVAAVFPLSSVLQRIKQYDGETIDRLERNPEGPDFIGYGLELHFSLDQECRALDLRWPTSFMRREFVGHLHEAFGSRRPSFSNFLNSKFDVQRQTEEKISDKNCGGGERQMLAFRTLN